VLLLCPASVPPSQDPVNLNSNTLQAQLEVAPLCTVDGGLVQHMMGPRRAGCSPSETLKSLQSRVRARGRRRHRSAPGKGSSVAAEIQAATTTPYPALKQSYAHAFLVVAALTRPHPAPSGLIGLTCNEVQQLLGGPEEEPVDHKAGIKWTLEQRQQVRAFNLLERWARALCDPRLLWLNPLSPLRNYAALLVALTECAEHECLAEWRLARLVSTTLAAFAQTERPAGYLFRGCFAPFVWYDKEDAPVRASICPADWS
jgi:hypothetical protein